MAFHIGDYCDHFRWFRWAYWIQLVMGYVAYRLFGGRSLQKFITNSYFVWKNIILIALTVSQTCLYMEFFLKNFSNGMRATPNFDHNGLFYLLATITKCNAFQLFKTTIVYKYNEYECSIPKDKYTDDYLRRQKYIMYRILLNLSTT